MMRHKRKRQLNERERAAAVEAASRLHRHVRVDMTNLVPASADYAALSRLSDAVIGVIRDLTGGDPEWMQPTPSVYVTTDPEMDDHLTGEACLNALPGRAVARGE